MEEVAKNKNTFWKNCCGWLMQIFYIYSWIIIITFIKSSDNFDPVLFLLFVLSVIVTIFIYIKKIVDLLISDSILRLLNNINENESIHEIMKKIFKEKPIVSISCNCYHIEYITYTSTD